MQTTYKFRLYPSGEEEKKLLFVLEICRLLYNSFLAIWSDSDKIPSRYKLQAMLPLMKEEHEGLKKLQKLHPQPIGIQGYKDGYAIG